uniref:condensation domain-containing protein n=1 Tax=Aquimarina sp. AU474 TaxID=2108529 RepID=UPI00135B15E0
MDTLLLELRNKNIGVTIVEGNIQLDVPKNVDASDLITKIRTNKLALLEYLNSVNRKSKNISKSPIKDYYALSAAQRRLYFLYELDKESLAYNQFQVLELDGVLDSDKLNLSFQGLLARHEILRTCFEVVDDSIYQKICESVDFEIAYYESSLDEYDKVLDDFIRPFDLGVAPLFRVGVIALSKEEHLLIVDMHHIITDGVSHGLMIHDFMSLYEGLSLESLPLQYKDYSEWQQSDVYQSGLQLQRNYWLAEYSEELSLLTLPMDHSRPEIKSYRGSNVSLHLSGEVTSSLRELGDREGATLFMTLLSILNILLSKLSNQEDVVVGTGVAGRSHADLEGIVGMFVNTLAIRNYPKGDLSFKDFLENVKEKTLKSLEYQNYPYEELVNHLDLPRDTSRNPLFDVAFVLQNFDNKELHFSDVKANVKDVENKISKFDLQLTGLESDEGLALDFEYTTDLFDKDTIVRFVTYFERIVDTVLSNPDILLRDIVVLDEKEQVVLLDNFNATEVDYPRDKTIIELFESQVKANPLGTALVYEGKKLSYRDLNSRSNALGSKLVGLGIGKGDIISVLLLQSFDMVISLLGILKSGASFLPIDAKSPKDRISYMLSDSGSKL